MLKKNQHKTNLFVWRIICRAVGGLDSWSGQQIIDIVLPMVELERLVKDQLILH